MFDLDDEIDNLETVAERYPADKKKEAPAEPASKVPMVKKPPRPACLTDAVIKDIEKTKQKLETNEIKA